MDPTEASAEQFLKSQGHTSIIYEPDGKVPPDFFVDQSIAVEVRRLNENTSVKGSVQGLEQADIPLEKVIREVVRTFGNAPFDKRKWYLLYRFARTLPPAKQIRQELTAFLERAIENQPQRSVVSIGDNLEVTAFADSYLDPSQFRIGIVSDENSGGMVTELLETNVAHCIAEKTKKIVAVRSKYAVWWLVLLDNITGGITDPDWIQFEQQSAISHTWDRVLLVDPTTLSFREVAAPREQA